MLTEYLVGAGRDGAGDLLRGPDRLHAPALCDLEVASAIRGLLLGGLLSERRTAEALVDLAEVPLRRHPPLDLLPRVLQLRANFTVYDGAYVALAEMLGATLITLDGGMARAVRTHTSVPVLPEEG